MRAAWVWLLFVFVAWPLGAQWRTPEPHRFHLERALQSPSRDHVLGTDVFGRDLFGYLPLAFQYTAFLGLISLILASMLALLFGWAFANFSRSTRSHLMHALDLWSSIPKVFLALIVIAAFRHSPVDGTWFRSSALVVLSAVLCASLPACLRQVAWSLDRVIESPAWQASQALGASPGALTLTHVLPAVLEDMRLMLPIWVSQFYMMETLLTFLGLGLDPSADSLGYLLIQAREYWVEAPHLAWVSGVPLIATVTSLHLLFERPYTSMGNLRERGWVKFKISITH